MGRAWKRRVMGFAILACAAVSGARAGDLPPAFAAKYQAASEGLKRLYNHSTIVGTLRREYPQTKKLLEQQYIYRANSPKMRLDVTTTADQGMGHKVGSADAFIATDIGSLVAYTGPTSQVFDTARELSYADAKSRIENGCPLTAPYKAVGQGTLLEILKSPSVKVDSVKNVNINGELLVKVTYEESSGKKNVPARKSWFVLSPSEGWAVREYARTTGDGDSAILHCGILKYDGMHDGVPLVSRIECWQEQGPQRHLIMREIIEITSFLTVDPSDYWFTAFTF